MKKNLIRQLNLQVGEGYTYLQICKSLQEAQKKHPDSIWSCFSSVEKPHDGRRDLQIQQWEQVLDLEKIPGTYKYVFKGYKAFTNINIDTYKKSKYYHYIENIILLLCYQSDQFDEGCKFFSASKTQLYSLLGFCESTFINQKLFQNTDDSSVMYPTVFSDFRNDVFGKGSSVMDTVFASLKRQLLVHGRQIVEIVMSSDYGCYVSDCIAKNPTLDPETIPLNIEDDQYLRTHHVEVNGTWVWQRLSDASVAMLYDAKKYILQYMTTKAKEEAAKTGTYAPAYNNEYDVFRWGVQEKYFKLLHNYVNLKYGWLEVRSAYGFWAEKNNLKNELIKRFPALRLTDGDEHLYENQMEVNKLLIKFLTAQGKKTAQHIIDKKIKEGYHYETTTVVDDNGEEITTKVRVNWASEGAYKHLFYTIRELYVGMCKERLLQDKQEHPEKYPGGDKDIEKRIEYIEENKEWNQLWDRAELSDKYISLREAWMKKMTGNLTKIINSNDGDMDFDPERRTMDIKTIADLF